MKRPGSLKLLLLLALTSRLSAAIVLEELESGSATSDPSSVTTSANLTAVDDHLYLASIAMKTNQTVSSVTGLGLTWVQVEDQCGGRSQTSLEVWMAQGSPTGDGTVTANFSSDPDSAVIAVARYSGVNVNYPIGNFETANTNGVGSPACTGGTDSSSYSFSTLDTTGADSVVFVAINVRNRTHTAGTGWTEQYDFRTGTGGSDAGLAIEDQSFSSITTDLTVSGTVSSTTDWAVIAVELVEESVSSVDLMTFSGSTAANGTLLEWTTALEIDNLGFHVFEESGGQRVRRTRQMIPGSALLSRKLSGASSRQSYQWSDAGPATSGQNGAPRRYWLQDIDISGRRSWHGPIDVGPAPASPSVATVATASDPGSHCTSNADGYTPAMQRRLWPVEPSGAARNIPNVLAGRLAIEFGVRTEGWYQVGQPELIELGLPLETDPRTLMLFADGTLQDIRVTGEDDGSFDRDDGVEFYGLGLESPWTDVRTYRLVVGQPPAPGVRPLGRIKTETALSPLPIQHAFRVTHEKRERQIYFAGLRNGERENFFGPIISSAETEETFVICDLDPVDHGSLPIRVTLQGVTKGLHHVEVQLNDTVVGELVFWDTERHILDTTVPSTLVHEGTNTVTLTAIGGVTDISMLESIRVDAWLRARATADGRRVSILGRRRARLGGFGHADLRVMDVTDPARPRELTGRVEPCPDEFAVFVSNDGDEPRTIFAFDPEVVRRPLVSAHIGSAWRRETEGASLVVLAHPSLVDALEPWLLARRAMGWSIAVVDVNDIYDEFDHGVPSPQALHRFLHVAATEWRVPPTHVLVVGDATYDPRRYLGPLSGAFVPSPLIETQLLETASDTDLVDFDGDGAPDLAIGRIPARFPSQVATVVDKILRYEAEAAASWSDSVLLVSDNTDRFAFDAEFDPVVAAAPREVNVNRLSLDDDDPATVRDTLLDELRRGQRIACYFGHGGVDVWANEGLLQNADARSLGNASRLPMQISLSCLNGFFHHRTNASLAEALLFAEGGGALAVTASSGATTPRAQAGLGQRLLAILLAGDSDITIGEAMVRAKRGV